MPAVHLVMLNRTAACFAILLMALFSGCSPVGEPHVDDVLVLEEESVEYEAATPAAPSPIDGPQLLPEADLVIWLPQGSPPGYAEAFEAAARRFDRAAGVKIAFLGTAEMRADLDTEAEVTKWYASCGRNAQKCHFNVATLDTYAHDIAGVVFHEVAHWFGAKHVKSTKGGSLMVGREGISGDEPISTADLVEICENAPCRAFVPEVK